MGSGKVLVLRVCFHDLVSSKGFRWPESGPVEAPDWDPTPDCGGGLHGLLWGEGDAYCIPGAEWADSKWLVVEVDQDDLVDLGTVVKFRRGEVVYCGDREGATRYLLEHGGGGRAINFAKASVPPRSGFVAGDFAEVTAAPHSRLAVSENAKVTAANCVAVAAQTRLQAKCLDLAIVAAREAASINGGFKLTLAVGSRSRIKAGAYMIAAADVATTISGEHHAVIAASHTTQIKAGHDAQVSAGMDTKFIGGQKSKLVAGPWAVASAEDRSTIVVERESSVRVGNHCKVVVEAKSRVEAGEKCLVIVGQGSRVKAGEGTVVIGHTDHGAPVVATFGHGGLATGQWYAFCGDRLTTEGS